MARPVAGRSVTEIHVVQFEDEWAYVLKSGDVVRLDGPSRFGVGFCTSLVEGALLAMHEYEPGVTNPDLAPVSWPSPEQMSVQGSARMISPIVRTTPLPVVRVETSGLAEAYQFAVAAQIGLKSFGMIPDAARIFVGDDEFRTTIQYRDTLDSPRDEPERWVHVHARARP